MATDITLRGELKLQRWDPRTGEISTLETTGRIGNGRPFTQARLELAPVTSVLLVETPAGS